MTCSICKGSGKRVVIVRHSQSQLPKTTIEWCLCTKAKFVSEFQGYKLLKRLNSVRSLFSGAESFLPFEKIDTQLKFNPDNLRLSPNLLIRSDPEDYFFFNLKSIIMMHRFSDPAPKFLCCTSLDLLKDFYVQQGDGTCPQLADVDRYDLLVFTLDNREKNDQLKTCVAQVVYNRMATGKPTWIYINQPTLSACTWEFSNELEEYLSKYENVSLEYKQRSNSQSKKSAGNFGRE